MPIPRKPQAWTPQFWKLSQGGSEIVYQDILDSIEQGLVYVHKDTKPLGKMKEGQGELFLRAPIGDYFYLTHGNKGITLLGQFSGPANLFSSWESGWLDRPFRFIRGSVSNKKYTGEDKWWSPNHDSTFCRVRDDELSLFEECILKPYFKIKLADFGIRV